MNKEELFFNLQHFTGTEHYYQHLFGIKYTDGVKYLADQAKCYWLIDLVASYQSDRRVRKAKYQVYELQVNNDNSCIVIIRDWDNRILAKQWLDYTDFPFKKFTCMFENNVLFLPSEY